MRGTTVREGKFSLTFCRGFPKRYQSLLASGELLEEWQDDSRAGRKTECFRADRQLWIVRSDLGGIRFSKHDNRVSAFPATGIDLGYFEQVVQHDWLPFVYPFWHSQVLHASAASHLASGLAVAFTGPSGSGKSTIAYGLGSRHGWQQLADDSLAFRTNEQQVEVVPIPNGIRLRPKSADYFGVGSYNGEELPGPHEQLQLRFICFLKPSNGRAATITPLKETEAYPNLLRQAFTMTTKATNLNRCIMRDYLALSGFTRAFDLSYPMRFESLEETLDLIEAVCLG